MDVKKIVLLIGALVIAAVAAVTARNMFTGASVSQAQAGPAKEVKKVPEVLVATATLPVGTIITPEALRFQPWPEGLVQPAYYVKQNGGVDPTSLVGTVVRNEITAGQPVTQGALIKPGERGFLAAALGPGMRAITVQVEKTSSVDGFVFPGDRVDIMMTQTVPGAADGGPPLKVAETILRNIRVLATDKRMDSVNAEGRPEVRNVKMVTLEVTPKIAEKIAVAQTFGSLSLSLRSLADNSADLERAIASGQLSVPEGDPKAESRMLVAVQGKPIDEGSTFTVGGEVSRYQRKTVPASPTSAAAYAGPTVRVIKGTSVTVIPVGAK